ncbi:MAG: hypothetical protein RL199_1000 [Pseudomonadota bacterium]|jgi:hypothetical protein
MRIPRVGQTPYAQAVTAVDGDGGGNGGALHGGPSHESPRRPNANPEVPRDIVEESSQAELAAVETSPLKLRARELVAPLNLTEHDWNAEGIEPWEDRTSLKARARVVVAEVTGKPWHSPFDEDRALEDRREDEEGPGEQGS